MQHLSNNAIAQKRLKQIFILPLCILVSAQSFSSIPAEDFFRPPAVTSVHISPTGSKASAIKHTKNNTQVVVINTENMQETIIFESNEATTGESYISAQRWIDDKFLSVQISEIRKGVEDLLYTKRKQKLLIFNTDAEKFTPYSVRTSGWLVDSVPSEDSHFVYAKSGVHSKLYKLNAHLLSEDNKTLGKLDMIDGGQFTPDNEMSSLKGYAIKWFMKSGKPKSALRFSDENKLELVVFSEESEESEEIIGQWEAEDPNQGLSQSASDLEKKELLPFAIADNEYQYYCLDLNEENERTIYRVNYKTGHKEKLFETTAFKIIQILVDEKDQFIGVYVLRNGVVTTEFSGLSEQPQDLEKGEINTVVSDSPGSQFRVIYRENHNTPGYYLLKNKADGRIKVLARSKPNLPNQLASKQSLGSLEVNKLDIPYILNTPDKTSKITALIVMPHGGPINVFDSPYYDDLTQFLIANNFAVLRVNYRGSSGHSDELKEAGKREWGREILNDIHSVTLHITKNHPLTTSRICLFGMSYGGYATASLLIHHPETYKCGVAIAGVYDLNLYLNERERPQRSQKWMHEYIGNSENDYDELIEISPVYSAEKLTRPLLIAHGAEDQIVDIEQTYRFKWALDKHKKIYQWLIIPDLGHSIGTTENAAMIMNKSIEFINNSLNQKKLHQ